MGIKEPFISEIAPGTYAINEFGIAAEFLVIGKERALLIDTGCGLIDLPGIIRRFTDKPYDVVLTHGHSDHVGGIGWFDKVYLHPADFVQVEHMDLDRLRGYNRSLGEAGAFQVYDYDPDAIHPIEKQPELVPITEGYVFDLGERKLEVIETPGHTPGSIVLVDDKARILFSGDACNVNLGLIGQPVSKALKYLQKLESLSFRFDQNWNGHIGYMGNPDCLAMPPHVLPTCVEICQSIVDGTAQPEKKAWFGGQEALCVIKNGVRISYLEI